MEFTLFQNKVSGLIAENRLLKFAVFVTSVSTIVCMFMAVHAAKTQRTIILPPVVDKRIVISGTKVNNDYIRLYSRYITSLLLCWHPSSIASNFTDLLTLATPEHFAVLENRLTDTQITMKKIHASSMFYPSQIKIDQKKKFFTVTGTRRLFTSATVLENTVRSYRVDYVITNGRLFVKNISEQEDP